MSSEANRTRTLLEVDDGEYCKRCGCELPGEKTDSEGRRVVWQPSKREWEVIEKCPDCWVRQQLRNLYTEAGERFNGEIPDRLQYDEIRPYGQGDLDG